MLARSPFSCTPPQTPLATPALGCCTGPPADGVWPRPALSRWSLSALCPPSPKGPRPASPWKVVSLAGSWQNGIALVPRDGKWSFLLGNSRHTGKSPKAS